MELYLQKKFGNIKIQVLNLTKVSETKNNLTTILVKLFGKRPNLFVVGGVRNSNLTK